MIEFLPNFGPDAFLVAVWFLMAMWNTSVGPTGGVNFATMASILPPNAVIPIQAVVEASSGVYRLWLLRSFVDLTFLSGFIGGGVIGFLIGIGLRFVAEPSDAALQIIMGGFILLTAWLPLAQVIAKRRSFPFGVGLATSMIGLFVGGVAALISAAAEQRDSNHRQVIATMTGGLLFHHGVKAALFGFFGFSFAGYAPLIAALLVAAFVGTWLGRRLLFDVPQHVIKPIFKALVTLLALNLIWRGLTG